VVGDRCAIAVRFSADGHGDEHVSSAEAHDILGMLGPLADLWDVVVGDYYGEEMATSRFVAEASLEAKIGYVRSLTGRPVVSVGRFTSPDTMVRQIRSGVLDLIGAARPSIADPFLPTKIREGRLEDIRECIGCNVCYAHNYRGAALRCTQNPTMGEEWRSGWHPETVPAGPGGTVLVVGAGPAGLEAALTLGRRGYVVALADAAAQTGGRVTLESRLPGLSEWGRVRDYRLGQLRRMADVTLYLGQTLTADDVRGFGADHVLIATGAHWRRDARGRTHATALENLPAAQVYTPDDLMHGARPAGPVVVYDDDHYYMGAVLARLLALEGRKVTYVTTEGKVAAWSHYTGEQEATHSQLLADGVEVVTNAAIAAYDGQTLQLACVYGGTARAVACASLVLVTSREPDDVLYRALVGEDPGDSEVRVQAIGDCSQPALIAHAVYSGHRAARELDLPVVRPGRDRLVVND
jgi:dimethylamine/trimethylamine dehydrogenase